MMDFMNWLADTLQDFESSGLEADAYLSQRLFSNHSHAETLSQTVSAAINAVSGSYSDLKDYQAVYGGSTLGWLAQTLEHIPESERGLAVRGLEAGMGLISDEDVHQITHDEASNVDLLAARVMKYCQQSSMFGAVALNDDMPSIPGTLRDVKLVQAFLEGDLGDKNHDEVTKVVSGAVVEASQNGLLPGLKAIPPESISWMVDRGLWSIKVIGKLGAGEFDAYTATDLIIDRTVATVNAAVRYHATAIGGEVGAWLGGTLGSVFGPGGTAVGSMIGRAFGAFAGDKVGNYVAHGIEKIGAVAQAVVRTTGEAVVEAGRGIIEGVASFGRGVMGALSSL